MRLGTKIILLTTSVAISVGLLSVVSIRGVIINTFRAELEKKAVSIAANLAERVANFILLGDYFQTSQALNEVLGKENDLEYIFITDEEGKIFAHTFSDGIPFEVRSWNPLYKRKMKIQLLETEKGFIRDVGIKIFSDTESELHLGIREDSLKYTLSKIRNITVSLTILVIFSGVIASVFISRLITKPLEKFVDFTRNLGMGDFSKTLEVQSRDEIGYLAHSFNRLSRELRAAREKVEETYTYTHLLQAEKLSSIGQISAGLAHELKNPVTTLKMLFQAFKEQPDMTKDDAEIIHNEIEKIDNILTRFLGFVRQKDFSLSKVDINALIDRVLSLVTFELRNYGIVAQKDKLETLPGIKGDRSLLEQVFLNFILNAIEAMPEGGEIRISGKAENNFVEVMFWDKGSGIPSDLRSKVFEPFFTTKAGGTGLGLSIAYNIVKSHGGMLFYHSKEGAGTVFTVRLPIGADNG